MIDSHHPDYCYVHHVIESAPEGKEPYIKCYECQHLYLTMDDLEEAHKQKCAELDLVLDPKITAIDIRTCPVCWHDF